MYCFRADCECDNDIDEAYKQGYNEAIQDFYDKVLNFEDYIKAEDIDGSCLLYAGRDITDMIVKIKNELIN